MARYLTEDQAAADGFQIVHEPDTSNFFVVHTAADGTASSVGSAHYTLRGEAATGGDAAAAAAAGSIDFDSTVVDPAYRGTGLSGLLAHRAVTDEIVRGRHVRASCWFIEGYLARHPELLAEAGALA
ncbi:N-acetyltransferase [Leucobacter chromiireducens]|uniref:N-acetyltransferase n=1 Tax=Leucobacter chromiireducens TaxID=283877 RepID=UPI000F6439BE|nr:N-acetyltransferase [Leucobacter chromiireducens]